MKTRLYLTPTLKYAWDISTIISSAISHIEKNKLVVDIHLFEEQEQLIASLPQFNLTDDGVSNAVGKTFLDKNGINIHINASISLFEYILFHEIGHAYLLTHYPNKQYDKSLHQQIRIICEELFCDSYALKNISNCNILNDVLKGHIDNYYAYSKDEKLVIKTNMSLLRACNIANYFPKLETNLTKRFETKKIHNLINRKKIDFEKFDNLICDFIDSN